MKLKFRKRETTFSTHWDAPLGDGRFYRIKKTYRYTLYFCDGLDANGISPTASKELWFGNKLNNCIQKAQEHADKLLSKKESKPHYTANSVSPADIRMPYKD